MASWIWILIVVAVVIVVLALAVGAAAARRHRAAARAELSGAGGERIGPELDGRRPAEADLRGGESFFDHPPGER